MTNKPPVRFSTTLLASFAGLNKQEKCLNWYFEYFGGKETVWYMIIDSIYLNCILKRILNKLP